MTTNGLVGPVLKVVFGEQGRFVLLGVALTLLYAAAQDFKRDVRSEALAVRMTLNEYIASNKAWQELSMDERANLLKKANARFRRLYTVQGWDYEELEP